MACEGLRRKFPKILPLYCQRIVKKPCQYSKNDKNKIRKFQFFSKNLFLFSEPFPRILETKSLNYFSLKKNGNKIQEIKKFSKYNFCKSFK